MFLTVAAGLSCLKDSHYAAVAMPHGVRSQLAFTVHFCYTHRLTSRYRIMSWLG